jgi:glycosyltransferase involved in cell wall biosynthesis
LCRFRRACEADIRILVITNLYPPAVVGGYEIGCHRLVQALERRGHEIHVLTGVHGAVAVTADEPHVYRTLPLVVGQEPGHAGWARAQWELRSHRALDAALRLVDPDVVYVFNVRMLSRSLLYHLDLHPVPVAYYVSDPWLAEAPEVDRWIRRWRPKTAPGEQWAKRVAKAALRRVAPVISSHRFVVDFATVPKAELEFTSAVLRDSTAAAGREVGHSRVIHWGVDPSAFPPRPPIDECRRFLSVGQLVEHKGVHTAVAAFVALAKAHPDLDLSLTIAGTGRDAAYQRRLEDLIAGAPGQVTFVGHVGPVEIAALYRASDVLVFSSEWSEPFSITLLEGMASGLAVVATMTGGTPEVARPDENVLAYEAGSVDDCHRQLERVLDLNTARSLQAAARSTIEEGFTLDHMAAEVDAHLRATMKEWTAAAAC